MFTIQDLFIYPIKSLGGIRLPQAQALERGFEFDRRWMLVDENGKFITQRIKPELALLQSYINSHSLDIWEKNKPNNKISIALNQPLTTTLKVTVWDDIVECFHLNEHADAWFTDYLQSQCKLVYMPENALRGVDPRFAQNQERVSFADSFPYLLISQASLDDLNSRLQQPVLVDQFRPNIVVSGTAAYAEDTWTEIKIGDVHFKVAKPCARCVVITINQRTAKKAKEPLLTLANYRTQNSKVLFGQNLLALNNGVIKSTDKVEVIR